MHAQLTCKWRRSTPPVTSDYLVFVAEQPKVQTNARARTMHSSALAWQTISIIITTIKQPLYARE